jgi:hypothetical protein
LPPFFDRPLSGLFVIAGMVLTLLLVACEPRPPSFLGFLVIGLIFGQLWLIGGWAAAGTAPRLARGCGLVLGILTMTTVISFLEPRPPSLADWGRAMAPSCFIAAPTFVAAILLRLLLVWKGIDGGRRFQFQIKEIMAWMVLVAVGAWALGFGDFRWLMRLDEEALVIAITGGAAGVAIVVWRYRGSIPQFCKSGFGAVIALLALGLIAFGSSISERELVDGSIGGGIYLSGALLAQSRDRRRSRRRIVENCIDEDAALLSQQN